MEAAPPWYHACTADTSYHICTADTSYRSILDQRKRHMYNNNITNTTGVLMSVWRGSEQPGAPEGRVGYGCQVVQCSSKNQSTALNGDCVTMCTRKVQPWRNKIHLWCILMHYIFFLWFCFAASRVHSQNFIKCKKNYGAQLYHPRYAHYVSLSLYRYTRRGTVPGSAREQQPPILRRAVDFIGLLPSGAPCV